MKNRGSENNSLPIITHDDLLMFMEAGGYKVNHEGMCAGFAYAGMYAILARRVKEHFNKRLSLMDDLLKDVKKINTNREEINEVLSSFIMERLKNEEFKEMWTGKTEAWRKEYVIRVILIKKIKEKLESLPLLDQVDIKSFFDTVSIHFRTKNYPDIFHKELHQHSINLIPLLTPVELENENKESNVHAFDPLYYSFNKNELNDFLDEIKEIAKKSNTPVALMISGNHATFLGKHAMTIGYDPLSQEWYFIDSSPAKIFSEKEEEVLTDYIMNVFAFNSYSNLILRPFALNSHREIILKDLNNLKELIMHDIESNRFKLNRVDSRGENLLDLSVSDPRSYSVFEKFISLIENLSDAQKANLAVNAILLDHMPALEKILECGININAPVIGLGGPIFYYATLSGNMDACLMLIQHGANIDYRDSYGRSVLCWISDEDQKKMLTEAANRYALEFIHKAKEYIISFSWAILRGKEILLDNSSSKIVPDYVAEQWKRIKLFENGRHQDQGQAMRETAREIIKIGQQVPDKSSGQLLVSDQLGLFKSGDYVKIEKELKDSFQNKPNF